MDLEQSGSASMVTAFVSNSLVGEGVTSARGKPFHHNTATSKENTGVLSSFASFFHSTCNLHDPQAILLCMALSAMIWCDIVLAEKPPAVTRSREKSK